MWVSDILPYPDVFHSLQCLDSNQHFLDQLFLFLTQMNPGDHTAQKLLNSMNALSRSWCLTLEKKTVQQHLTKNKFYYILMQTLRLTKKLPQRHS